LLVLGLSLVLLVCIHTTFYLSLPKLPFPSSIVNARTRERIAMKSKCKVLSSDIDGMALRSDHTMSKAVADTFRNCMNRSCTAVLASSRSPQGMMPIVRANRLERVWIAVYGGGLLLDAEGRTIRTRIQPRTYFYNRAPHRRAFQRCCCQHLFHRTLVCEEPQGPEDCPRGNAS